MICVVCDVFAHVHHVYIMCMYTLYTTAHRTLRHHTPSMYPPCTTGQVVLFTWLDHLLTNPDTWTLDTTTATNTCDTNCTDTPLPTDTHHHHHHNSSPSPATPHTSVPAIVHGQPITERKSTFQAHVASVHSVEDVQSVMQALLAVNKIRAATHNIMAYRIQHPGTQLLMQVGGGVFCVWGLCV